MKEEVNAPLLEVKNLKVSFKAARSIFAQATTLRAVKDISFSLGKGQSLGIVGESGCGKSTLARVLAGIQKATEGEILFKGEKVCFQGQNNLQSRLQMIFQDPFSSLNPRIRVWRQIVEPLYGHGGIRDKKVLKTRAEELLLQVGLTREDGRKYPHQFSGGQRQRVAIARSLALEPEILVADEPTASLDVNSQEEISLLLKRFVAEKELTLILISHDLTSVKHLAEKVMVLYMGSIMEYGTSNRVLNHALHPYTRALLDSAPTISQRISQRRSVRGDVPSAFENISGCPFQGRCPEVMPLCTKKMPELREHTDGHFLACHLQS